MDKRLLAVSSRPAYLDAVEVLDEQGVDLDLLPGCVKRWVASDLFKSRKVPVALERWLLTGMWRGYLPQPELALGAPGSPASAAPPLDAAGPADQATWSRVSARLHSALSEVEFSYVSRAFLAERSGLLFLVAATSIARDRIRDRMWKRIAAWWSETDPGRRPLTLISKAEFEAGAARQVQGV